jgi:two-component system, cell cycle sensor histidine kinase and response regulator CckA
MPQPNESVGGRILSVFGLHPVAHRPPLTWRFWIYSVTAYLMPVVVHVALPAEGTTLDELVWLVTLVPAFLLALHYGLRGAFAALVVGIALLVGVQIFLVLAQTPGDPRMTVPIFIAYGALAISVGWLSEQLHDHYEYALELQAARKAEALGTMAAGIAHDFNNILTAVVASGELIASDLGPDASAARNELEELKASVRRGAGIVRNMLGFSRRGMLALRPVDLPRLVDERRELVRRLAPEPVEVRFEVDEDLPPILADREAVEQILVNLVTNARDAMPYGGTLEIAVRNERLGREHRSRTGWGDPGDYACLSVVDNGAGMDQATLTKIFEPFFTEKEPGEGVGLGMAMVYGLIKQHQGFVDVQSEPGQGTAVRVYFPVTKDRVVPSRPERPETPTGGTETILLVEDDETIRRAAQRILEHFGYTVIAAADGQEALNEYHQRRGEVDLIVTDVVLPKLSGPELYQAIRAGSGRPRVLFMSGYPARTVQATTHLDPTLPFLHKPWTVAELTAAVRGVLDEAESQSPVG